MTSEIASVVPDAVLARFRENLEKSGPAYLSLLKELVDIKCGSEMVAGVQEVNDIIERRLTSLDMTVKRHPAQGFGDHLVAANGLAGQQIILGGHTDTTFTDYRPLPSFSISGEKAIGPGTCDMKGGIVVMLAALECLNAAGALDELPITVVLNSDEERAAPTSRDLFRTLAKHAECALFFECGGTNGEVVISRRAKLSYELDVRGQAHHAGLVGENKASALQDIAYKILAVENLNKNHPGATFNVGRAWGGEARNTVPGSATALVDIWFWEPESEQAIRSEMEAIGSASTLPGCESGITLTGYRPAWPQTRASLSLLERARTAAALLDQQLPMERRGGTADSSWFGAAGIPTLDGLGPIGFGDHTPQEHILLQTLYDRIILTATFLATFVTWEYA